MVSRRLDELVHNNPGAFMSIQNSPSRCRPSTIEALGDHHFRVCGEQGCVIVKGWNNAQYLSRHANDGALQSRYLFED
jgi:hypothetical protein